MTETASMVPAPPSVPMTLTWSPTETLGKAPLGPLNFVDGETLTVMFTPLAAARVKPLPVTEATRPARTTRRIITVVASMVPVPAWAPVTATFSPARTSARPGERTVGSR